MRKKNRNVAVRVTAIGILVTTVVGGSVMMNLLAQSAITPIANPPTTSPEKTIPVQRVPDGTFRDFCSTKPGPNNTCVDVQLKCAAGWERVCQGTCGCRGGQICQCVQQTKSAQVNTCGNGICEPGEYRTQQMTCAPGQTSCTPGNRLVPTSCERDCAALATSGITGGSCYSETLSTCLARRAKEKNAQVICEEQAKRTCGESPAPCDNVKLKQCIDRLIVAKTSAGDAEKQCRAQCATQASTTSTPVKPADTRPAVVPPSKPTSTTSTTSAATRSAPSATTAPTSGCTEDERATCISNYLIQGKRLSSAQEQCDLVCSKVQQTDRSFQADLKKRVTSCSFDTLGRCCEVAKTLGVSALLSTCRQSCAEARVPDGDKTKCQ